MPATSRLLHVCTAAALVVLIVACQGSPPPTGPQAPGERLYAINCATCHAPSGHGVGDVPTIVGSADILAGDYARTVISEGRNKMPSFASTLTPTQINEIVDYIATFHK